MADRYLLESSATDGYLLEDSSGVLLLEVASDPPKPIDWPSARHRRAKGFIDLAPNLLLTTLAVAAAATVLRGPIYSQPHERSAPQPDVFPNLLVTTLAAAPEAAPFSQEDWPQRTQRARLSVEQPLNLLTSTLAPAAPVAAPFAQSDWPVTRRTGRRDVEVAPNLLVSAQAPFTQFDVLSVHGRLRRELDQPLNLLQTTLAPVEVAAPFAQREWDARYRQVTRFDVAWSQSLLQTTLTPTAQAPFTQLDWPTARLRGRLELVWTQNLLQSTLAPGVVAAPFVSVDFLYVRHHLLHDEAPLPNLLMTTLAPEAPPAPAVPRRLVRRDASRSIIIGRSN